MLSSVLTASFLFATNIAAECSRNMLKEATSQLVAAQTAGDHSLLTTVATNLNYTEREQPAVFKTGILATPLKLDSIRNTHDTQLCATFTEMIAASNPKPYVIGTRMLFTDNKITTIENLVTHQGDWAFNATGYQYYNSQEKWDPIPEGKRDSYAVIKAAGDAYFERFQNASFEVPWGIPCARLEGGISTGGRNQTGNTCNLGLPSTIKVTNRRYVIDEEMGTVDIFCGFPGLDRSVVEQPMPDSHFFRIEGGKIRSIHTLSSCVNAGCGMNGRGPPGFRSRKIRKQ